MESQIKTKCRRGKSGERKCWSCPENKNTLSTVNPCLLDSGWSKCDRVRLAIFLLSFSLVQYLEDNIFLFLSVFSPSLSFSFSKVMTGQGREENSNSEPLLHFLLYGIETVNSREREENVSIVKERMGETFLKERERERGVIVFLTFVRFYISLFTLISVSLFLFSLLSFFFIIFSSCPFLCHSCLGDEK